MADQVEVHEKGFTVLYEAPEPTVDIVFVHGFTGHPKDTWLFKSKARTGHRAKKDGRNGEPSSKSRRSKIQKLVHRFAGSSSTSVSTVSSPQSSRTPTTNDSIAKHNIEPEGQQQKDVYWPADLASETVPDSRILTYGYDTKLRHWATGPVSKNRVYDHAGDLLSCLEALRRKPNERHRPILFVAHSLGGIVLKEALRRSEGYQSSKAHLFTIFEATKGILFFGTPHRGTDPRKIFHHVIAVLLQGLGLQVNEQIVSTLMPGAERLAELRDEFPVLWQKTKAPNTIYSFQEEYGVGVLSGKKVVDDESSCLDNSILETKQFISSNHMDMCRFSGLGDQEYAKVAAALTHILETANGRADTISHGQSPRRSQSQSTHQTTHDERFDREPSIVGVQSIPNQKDIHSIPDETRKSLIEQLYFTKIDERLTSLTAAQGKTCRWFLSKPEYTSWRDPTQQPDHGGFLWIRGHPGTGKSTLMKLLFEEAKEQAKQAARLSSRHESFPITLSFFFLARGTLEEKSTTGLYRSLLHQLFGKAADLQDSLDWMTADGARGIQANGWHEVALKQTFKDAISKLGNRSLTIFVDALDECDDDQAKDMVCFFEELCELAQEKQVQLHICFSSRHYPHIEIKNGLKIILEDEAGHEEDIKQYINAKLRLRASEAAQSLQSEVLERSQLIFLWVVLVVNILNHDYPGKPIEKMRERLREIPKQLEELFEMILRRDGENPELLQLCLKWILFAVRPLKPQELYFAVQFGLDQDEAGIWNKKDVDLDLTKTSVREWSKGLAEVTRSNTSEIQFIHESVRDFLLGRYRSQWSGSSSNFTGCSHEVLRDCCLAQVNAAFSQLENAPAPSDPTTTEATQYGAAIRQKSPFLEYSVFNVFHHANSAQQYELDQGVFLGQFPLRSWKTLHNRLQEWQCGEAVGLLYVLAERNLVDLIRVYPWSESCFFVKDEPHEPPPHYGPPIFAALATQSTQAAQALLQAEVRGQPYESALRDLCNQHPLSKRGLMKLGRQFVFSKTKGVVHHLVEQGEDAILEVLLNSRLIDVDVDLRDLQGRTPLSYTAEKGHVSVMQLLLEKGAKPDLKDELDMSPLSHAARGRHEVTVKLLLENGADANAKHALSNAAEQGHLGIVTLLLEHGAEVDVKDYRGMSPLTHAAYRGRGAIVTLLLENGADIEWKDNDGQTPLSRSAGAGREAVVELLLRKGAEVESEDTSGRTSLSHAAQCGHEAVVKLLYEAGAQVNSRDKLNRTPLWHATNGWKPTADGRRAVREFLFARGAT